MSPILIYLTSLLDHDFCVRVALTMLHFLWQGIALGLLVYLSTRIFMRYRASVRYCVNVIALSSMMICVPLTYAWLGSKRTPESSISLAAYSPVADRLPVASFTLESGFTDDTPMETPTVVYTSPAKLPSGNLKSLPTIATVLYLTGAAIMTIRLLLGLWGGHRLQRCSVSVVDPALLRMLECQARRLGIRFQPAVAYCSRATAPVVVGILRPTILLPISLASGLTPDQLETIFMHELAHIRRRDLIVNLFQRVAESLLFFHPAVWYVSRRISLEREHCCDDVVIDAGYEHLRYAGALVRMAELCCGSSSSAGSAEVATLAATGDSPSQLKRRVVRLLDQEPCVRFTRRGTILTAFAFLFPSHFARCRFQRFQSRAGGAAASCQRAGGGRRPWETIGVSNSFRS